MDREKYVELGLGGLEKTARTFYCDRCGRDFIEPFVDEKEKHGKTNGSLCFKVEKGMLKIGEHTKSVEVKRNFKILCNSCLKEWLQEEKQAGFVPLSVIINPRNVAFLLNLCRFSDEKDGEILVELLEKISLLYGMKKGLKALFELEKKRIERKEES